LRGLSQGAGALAAGEELVNVVTALRLIHELVDQGVGHRGI